MWRQSPADSAPFVDILVAAGVAALAAGNARLGHVPDDLIEACRTRGLPLLEVPVEVSFGAITDVVNRRLVGLAAGELRSALGRHRRIVAAVAEGAGLDQLFALIASELSVTATVISATGSLIAGQPLTYGPSHAAPQLPTAGDADEGDQGDEAVRLAREFLTAPRLPTVVDGPYTIFAVDRSHRTAGWALVCSGELDVEIGYELASCVALERTRMEEGRRVERRLTEQLIALAASPTADPSELAARLRTCGIEPTDRYAIVTATVTPASPHSGRATSSTRSTPPVTSGNSPGTSPADAQPTLRASGSIRPAAATGPDPVTLGGQVLEELLGRQTVAATTPDGAIALVRLPTNLTAPRLPRSLIAPAGAATPSTHSPPATPRTKGTPTNESPSTLGRIGALSTSSTAGIADTPLSSPTSSAALAATLRFRAALLMSASTVRVAIGVSAELTSPAAIRGGVEEASHAHRLASLRGGGVVMSDEIYTHDLLLATVPDTVRRSYASHLLDPLLDYDRQHQADLVRTLNTFLDCAGSWNICAERLHVHVNTVRYRIRRVEDLTGKDLSAMSDRVDLFLALRAV